MELWNDFLAAFLSWVQFGLASLGMVRVVRRHTPGAPFFGAAFLSLAVHSLGKGLEFAPTLRVVAYLSFISFLAAAAVSLAKLRVAGKAFTFAWLFSAGLGIFVSLLFLRHILEAELFGTQLTIPEKLAYLAFLYAEGFLIGWGLFFIRNPSPSGVRSMGLAFLLLGFSGVGIDWAETSTRTAVTSFPVLFNMLFAVGLALLVGSGLKKTSDHGA